MESHGYFDVSNGINDGASLNSYRHSSQNDVGS